MVTLYNLIILSFLNHLNLVNTSFAISTRSSSSNSREAYISIIRSLTVVTGRTKALCWYKTASFNLSWSIIILLSIEGEGVQKRLLLSVCLISSSNHAGTKASPNQTKCQDNFERNHG